MAEQILSEGALISEYIPGTQPLPQHFPQRNRIISGLCIAVVVIEAASKEWQSDHSTSKYGAGTRGILCSRSH